MTQRGAPGGIPQGTPVFGPTDRAYGYGVPASQMPRQPVGVPETGSPGAAAQKVGELEAERDALKAQIEKMRLVAGNIGILIERVGDKGLLTLGGGKFASVNVAGWNIELGTGMQLAATKEGALKIVDTFDVPPGGGRVVTVERVNGNWFEYDAKGEQMAANVGRFGKLEAGDRVMLDGLNAMAVRHVGKVQAKSLTQPTNVSWSDIGGLEDVKRELREAVEDPIRYKELYAKFGQRAPKGVLLAGPPGTGKTLCAMACATAIAELHGKSAMEGGYIYVSGPEILNKFIGESESTLRTIFKSAQEHHKKHGYPCVVCFDEADSLLGKRGSTRWEGMERTIVPQILALMDGLEYMGAFVMVLTNRPNMLDPALLRDGRLDRRVYVPRPDRPSLEAILRVHLAKRPGDARALAALAADLLFKDEYVVRRLAMKDGTNRDLCLKNVVSGAMAYGLVHRAVQLMLRRSKQAMEAGRADAAMAEELCEEDFKVGVRGMLAEEKLGGHEDELMKLANGDEVVRIETPS